MTRLHMPVPINVHAFRKDTDGGHENREIRMARCHADLVFEIWYRGDEQVVSDFTLSDFIAGALGQAS